jgi:universal stress protein A
MTETLKVLVPIDFSEASRRALAWAFDYATRAPVELHLLHVVEDGQRYDEESLATLKTAEVELERMVPNAKERAGLGVIRQHVLRGTAAPEILRLAGSVDAEMIVMGSRGRSAIAELFLGSVADRVVRSAICPVVVVKA